MDYVHMAQMKTGVYVQTESYHIVSIAKQTKQYTVYTIYSNIKFHLFIILVATH